MSAFIGRPLTFVVRVLIIVSLLAMGGAAWAWNYAVDRNRVEGVISISAVVLWILGAGTAFAKGRLLFGLLSAVGAPVIFIGLVVSTGSETLQLVGVRTAICLVLLGVIAGLLPRKRVLSTEEDRLE